jgi:hypothetical protein
MTLPAADVERVARVLASQAAVAAEPDSYLRDVIQRSELPQQFRLQVLGKRFADLGMSARELVRWADNKGVNPSDPRLTTLGSLIYVLLEDDVGLDLAADLVAVMVVHRLVRSSALREDLTSKFQVPITTPHMDETFPLPVIDGEIGEGYGVELQRMTPKPPDLLDVGFLTLAIRQAACVCRIERPDQTAVGTGFLIGPDLVLTNRHVVDAAQTSNIQLRFRYTSMAGGIVVGLRSKESIPRFSDVDELDFAALRVERPLSSRDGIESIELTDVKIPVSGDALSILQHPGGGPVKLALTTNGVIRTFPERSAIRYVTAAMGGSSGSPCFNEDWKVVAIHRAERSTMFGTVREGIVINEVRQRIMDLL